MTQIGITERGDISQHIDTLQKKLDNPDFSGFVLITKNLSNPSFLNILHDQQDKIILHSTITFLGGTIYEPHVPSYQQSFQYIKTLIQNGFPPNHIVFRIDPIINFNQIQILEKNIQAITKLGIKRFRFSFCQFYPHVKKRFTELKISLPILDNRQFTINFENQQIVLKKISQLAQKYNIEFELCGQQIPNHFVGVVKRGCISEIDLKILKIQLNENIHIPEFKQRKLCDCLNVKKEILNVKKPCSHGCIYCYWKN